MIINPDLPVSSNWGSLVSDPHSAIGSLPDPIKFLRMDLIIHLR